ncbi:hypothetical protein JJB09_26070 [Rhizobium sp. KVB221]|uniref:Uncharacterized protein n=1 Tax=Rhizobium setariae TaxID=2801340 RepID=A0A936YRM3_9HYPH|nr:hypothetical protein [Rhizobium setariae]MBL0375478.1 hypothetical protein [Rhizobium setariae]
MMNNLSRDEIQNQGSDADSPARRSGGTANDPHGGYERIQTKDTQHPDRTKESLTDAAHANVPKLPDDVAPETFHITRDQPGFGPTEFDKPTLQEGNPELGPDPANLPSTGPSPANTAPTREGMYETGIRKDDDMSKK